MIETQLSEVNEMARINTTRANRIAGAGYYSHEVPSEAGQVVLIRDGQHEAKVSPAAVLALVDASGITDGTGTLYTVCEQAIRDGEGTSEDVRRIWAEATEGA